MFYFRCNAIRAPRVQSIWRDSHGIHQFQGKSIALDLNWKSKLTFVFLENIGVCFHYFCCFNPYLLCCSWNIWYRYSKFRYPCNSWQIFSKTQQSITHSIHSNLMNIVTLSIYLLLLPTYIHLEGLDIK